MDNKNFKKVKGSLLKGESSGPKAIIVNCVNSHCISELSRMSDLGGMAPALKEGSGNSVLRGKARLQFKEGSRREPSVRA